MLRILRRRSVLCASSFILGCTFTLFSIFGFKNKFPYNDSYNALIKEPPDSNKVLLILILSSINNVDRRTVIRETWMVNASTEVKHYFVLSTSGISSSQQNQITVEQEKYNDLLIFTEIEDSFYSLTFKVLVSFAWATGLNSRLEYGTSSTQRPQGFKFLLKCDDDSYVQLDKLLDELKNNFVNEKGKNLYWGFFDGRAEVKKKGKYAENQWNICDLYLPYALGGGYILSRSLVEYISINAEHLKVYNSEDISVGAWLSSYADINRLHDPRFDTEYISRGCFNSYLITHKHSVKQMKDFHHNLKTTGKLCQHEFRSRLSYEYNWNVPPSKCCVRGSADVP